MSRLIEQFLNLLHWSLIKKELHQIRHNPRLLASLIVQPMIQILIFGAALNPEVKDLRLAIIDESRSIESRQLISKFTESNSFKFTGLVNSEAMLERAMIAGQFDIGIIIPRKFSKDPTPMIAVIIDGVDANRATIASNYADAVLKDLNQHIVIKKTFHGSIETVKLDARTAFYYNPGLRANWFFVTGALGIILILNGSIVAAAAIVKEREEGTIEQLLMLPVSEAALLLAKIAPLSLLLLLQSGIIILIGKYFFAVPVRGNILLLFFACGCCILVGTGLGAAIAIMTRSQYQAQLMTIFVIPPLVIFSGGITPIESMPYLLQQFTYLNPLRHFTIIARGVMLKGVGIGLLAENFIILSGATIFIIGINIYYFKRVRG